MDRKAVRQALAQQVELTQCIVAAQTFIDAIWTYTYHYEIATGAALSDADTAILVDARRLLQRNLNGFKYRINNPDILEIE